MPTPPTQPVAPAPSQEHLRHALGGAPWGLVSYRGAGRADATAGLLGADGQVRVLDLGLGDGGMLALLGEWEDASEALAGLDPDSLPVAVGARVGLPISYPPKIVCAGANYYSHVEEMGNGAPPPGVGPYFFLKPPSTTMIADSEAVNIGAWEGAQVDWEAELAVVIGRRVTRVAADEAMAAVAGYVVTNDITDRSRLHREPNGGPPFAFDWVSTKARDRSCPIGPAVVPSFLVEDPHNLAIRLWVNEELKQDSTTADMIFDIPTLIAAASEVMTLEPGDLLATGTPAGVGRPRNEYLVPGDSVTIQIDGVGRLQNAIAI